MKIVVKEVPIEETLKVRSTIEEFEPHEKKYLEDKIRGKESLIIVAYIEKEPVGYMISYDRFADGSIYCWSTAVNKKFRKMGALKSMMGYMESWAKKKGYKKIKLKTRNKRREMLSYLVKNGFYFLGVKKCPDAEENRIFVEKAI